MRVGLFTREYSPLVYGGAGVHVDYLSRELARTIEVEVHCWGPQQADDGNLHVRGAEPWAEITNGTEGKFKGALEALSLNLTQVKALEGIDVVHTHTWYVSMAGFLAKKLYGVPFVLTTHSLEPLRAWKAEQLGSGYAMSSWMERTAILDAVETNIVIFKLKGGGSVADLVARMKARGIVISTVGRDVIRLVTHLDVSRGDCITAAEALTEEIEAA